MKYFNLQCYTNIFMLINYVVDIRIEYNIYRKYIRIIQKNKSLLIFTLLIVLLQKI